MGDDLTLILEQLAAEDRPVRSVNMAPLSDLSRDQVERFASLWPSLPAERRTALARLLVEQSEINIHWNFHAVFRVCLSDPIGEIRQLAVDGLWEDERPTLIGRLILLLESDPDSGVRAAAATSLGRFVLRGVLGEISEGHAARAEAALHASWSRPHEPVEVRRRVLEGLAYSTDASVIGFINNAYLDDAAHMRQSALYAMGRSADSRWSKIVLRELRSIEPEMRFEATVAAGELGIRAAVNPLIGTLDDPDSNLREAAAMALGKIGGKQARQALEAALGGDDARLAEAASEALEELTFNSSPDEVDLTPDDAPHRSAKDEDPGLDDDDLDDFGDDDDTPDDFADDDTDLFEEDQELEWDDDEIDELEREQWE